MKKFLLFLCSAVIFLFTSCIDVVESISLQDGKYKIDYKVTISKTLLEMAESFSSSKEKIDIDSIYDDFLKDLPSEVSLRKIDNDFEIGLRAFVDIDKNPQSEEIEAFLSKTDGSLCAIHLIFSQDDLSENVKYYSAYEAIAMGMLSCAKYRLIISKNIIPYVTYSYVESDDGKIFLDAYDYGDVYGIEMPVIIFLQSKLDLNLYIETDENAEKPIQKDNAALSRKAEEQELKKDESNSRNGPFGLAMGMSYDQITSACGGNEPRHIADDRYYIRPKKAHPLFGDYVAWISEGYGLYYIKGLSREIKTNNYGTEVKQEFEKLLSSLEKRYGKFNKTDTLDRKSIWDSDQYWMQALAQGARICEASWQAAKNDIEKFNGLVSIDIGIKTRATYITNEAYIWIEYGFANQGDGFNDLDDVL